MLNDNLQRYGLVTKLLHWVMAVLVLWQMLKIFDDYFGGKHWVKENLVSYHGSIGLILLVLIAVRVIWAIAQRKQRPMPAGRVKLVEAVHGLLYLTLILAPVTAVCLMLGKGYGLRFFGNTIIERGVGNSEFLASIGSLHSSVAWLLLMLLLGHMVMALWHHFVKKDDTLKKML